MPKRSAPEGCYWRGQTLWGRATIAGREHRWSLGTSDAKVARARRAAEKARLIARSRFGDDRKIWDDAVEAWADHIAANVGPTTIKRYSVSLAQVSLLLAGRHLDEIDRALMAEIVRDRRARGASNATIRRDLGAVSSVLGFCEDHEWITANPALAQLKRLKERRDPIVLPEPADIERVIARAPGLFATMIRAAWLTGCRQEELSSLERSRVDLHRRQATIVGKGNKLRTIDLHGAYGLLRAAAMSLRSKFVFWHGEGDPYANVASRFAEMTASAQKAAQAEGAEFRRFRFHDLRHRFAVDFLKEKLGTIYDLQLHLGHSSIKTTELYLQYLTPEEARAAKGAPAQNPARLQRFDTVESDKKGS
jgi:integrase/recombinase XerD